MVDFGSGHGLFTIPAARIISGTVYAFVIDPSMIDVCKIKVEESGICNVVCELCDFVNQGTGLPINAVDYLMLFNILHAENPVDLLLEAKRNLVQGGKLGVIHWNHNPSTPRGPSMDIRPRPEQCQDWIKAAGFELIQPLIDLPPYHYGIVAQKDENSPTELS